MVLFSRLFVVAICLVSSGDAFLVPGSNRVALMKLSLAKGSGGRGFGKTPEPPTPKKKPSSSSEASSSDETSSGSTAQPLQSVQGGSNAVPVIPSQSMAPDPDLDPNLPPEERAKILLSEKYGLRTREEQQVAVKKEAKRREQQKRQEELKKMEEADKDIDLLAMIPPPVLIAIDRFLKIGASITTVAFVLAGIGITIEAWSAATGNPLPENVDQFIVNVVEPNFTTGLLVLLGFSISLGVFAAAQLGSESSSYKEDN